MYTLFGEKSITLFCFFTRDLVLVVFVVLVVVVVGWPGARGARRGAVGAVVVVGAAQRRQPPRHRRGRWERPAWPPGAPPPIPPPPDCPSPARPPLLFNYVYIHTYICVHTPYTHTTYFCSFHTFFRTKTQARCSTVHGMHDGWSTRKRKAGPVSPRDGPLRPATGRHGRSATPPAHNERNRTAPFGGI